jgi:hypothetical protein
VNETATMTGTAPRWWVDEYTAVPDPIEADTDYCFDTAAEAAEHGQPWAVLEHPAAYTSGPVSPSHGSRGAGGGAVTLRGLTCGSLTWSSARADLRARSEGCPAGSTVRRSHVRFKRLISLKLAAAAL